MGYGHRTEGVHLTSSEVSWILSHAGRVDERSFKVRTTKPTPNIPLTFSIGRNCNLDLFRVSRLTRPITLQQTPQHPTIPRGWPPSRCDPLSCHRKRLPILLQKLTLPDRRKSFTFCVFEMGPGRRGHAQEA